MIERVLPLRSSMQGERPLFDVHRTRAIEQRCAAALPAGSLMARAGESLARLTLAVAPHAHEVRVAAGPGNNGGDGLAAAALLQGWGKQVVVGLTGDPAALPADAATALQHAKAAGVTIIDSASADLRTPDVAIDALLGIGTSRAPLGAIAEAIHRLNGLACPVIAVDLPSGLDALTGQPLGEACVNATHTLAMLSLKPGLFTGSGRDHAGEVWLAALGCDAADEAPCAWLAGMPKSVAPRRHAQNKGSFGDVAVVGGSHGMNGAGLLAARAAHAAGAGRVYLQLLDASAPALDPIRPELMFRHDWSDGLPAVLAHSTVVCGCGGGDAVRALLPRLLSLAGRLVLDADALNALSHDAALAIQLKARSGRGRPTVLTPHPLEAARLLGCDVKQVQADRLKAAAELTARFEAIVVLKGSGSVIAAPGATPRINATGNAALATAGTGDVLAGWLGGRWAQAHDDSAATAFIVACHAVAEHGSAAEPQPSGALLASDLIERLHRG
jgi:hydroxyethylthiazole kinase-like uncharacterized protein yjeF